MLSNIIKDFLLQQGGNIMRIKEVYKLKSKAGVILPSWIDELYTKKDSPYFFTKIYGRDEFMLVDLSDLTLMDIPQRFKRFLEKEILKRKMLPNDMKGLNRKPYFFISSKEASLLDANNLQFIDGAEPPYNLTFETWEKLSGEYMKGVSELADISDYFLLLLRLLKDKVIYPEEIDINSSRLGHYRDGKEPKNKMEKTGARELAGLSIFGNTSKTVKNSWSTKFKYAQLGGGYLSSGKAQPLGYKSNFYLGWIPSILSNGLVVLRP